MTCGDCGQDLVLENLTGDLGVWYVCLPCRKNSEILRQNRRNLRDDLTRGWDMQTDHNGEILNNG